MHIAISFADAFVGLFLVSEHAHSQDLFPSWATTTLNQDKSNPPHKYTSTDITCTLQCIILSEENATGYASTPFVLNF